MDILETAILEMCRKHQTDSFLPSEVVQTMYPIDWKYFMEDVNQKAWELYLKGIVCLTQDGKAVDKNHFPKAEFLIYKPKDSKK